MIGSRIEQIRKNLGLSQEKFGSKINMAKSSISLIENNTRDANDRVIQLICTEFNVNEYWLRTGQGEMFLQTDVNILSEIEKQFSLDALDKQIILQYLKLNEFERKVIKDYLLRVVNTHNEETK